MMLAPLFIMHNNTICMPVNRKSPLDSCESCAILSHTEKRKVFRISKIRVDSLIFFLYK